MAGLRSCCIEKRIRLYYGIVKLSDEEIARRKAELKPYEPNVKGYLKRYAAHVSSAASGAIYVE